MKIFLKEKDKFTRVKTKISAKNCGTLFRGLAGIGEIANISNAERQTPNAERRTPKVLDRPVGRLDINFFGKV